MNTRHITLAIAAALAVSGTAQAQNFRPGAQLTLSIPENNQYQGIGLGSKPGYGFGLHGLIPLKDGHAIVPRIDFIKFDNKGNDPIGFTTQIKTTTISIGADYQYHFGGDSIGTGFYVTGGARYSSNKEDISVNDTHGYGIGANISVTERGAGFAGGCGYMLTPHMGAEIRYNTSGLGYAGSTFDASFVFRF